MTSRLSFCSVCNGIDYNKPYGGPEYKKYSSGFSTHWRYTHHASVRELESCVSLSGCMMCRVILAVIQDHHVKLPKNNNGVEDDDHDEWEHADVVLAELESDFDESKIQNSEKSDEDSLDILTAPVILETILKPKILYESENRTTNITVHWTDEPSSTRQSCQRICLVGGLSEEMASFLSRRELWNDTSTGSARALELARMWLDTCPSTHPECRERMKSHPTLLPTRVIDVGDGTRQPFLHVSSPCQKGEYVALSHCWGKGKQFTTNTASLAERQRGIKIEDMPKTFRDAVQIARQLGFRLLWIDSLCIIQDSREDWAREAREMGRYYRGASLTVFARDSAGDDEGCFKDRDGDLNAPHRTPMFDGLFDALDRKAKGSTVSFIQRESIHRHGHHVKQRRHGFENIEKLEPWPPSLLHQRGWTLQEWILSTRSLIFTSSEVEWVCPRMSACECLPEGIADTNTSQVDQSVIKIQDRGDDGLELEEFWNTTVREFSVRQLTVASDKLPAVAGIASEFCKLKSGEYVAGLWKDDYFRSHLAWRSSFGKCRRSSDYRAPSWSWASTDGEIRTPSIKRWEPRGDVDKRALPLLCDIIDCWVVPKNSENALGEVKTGVLTLRGCMRRAVVSQSHVHDQDTGQKLGDFNLDDPSELASLPEVWCMPLLHDRDARLHCLAMRPATEEEGRCARGYGGVEKSVFRRVGIVEPFWRDVMPGDREYTNHRVEAGSVYAELTESRSSIRALLDWFEGANQELISII